MEQYAENDAKTRKDQKEDSGGKDCTWLASDMPQDVNAFFKHPLVTANQAEHGEAIALLHEYQIFSDLAEKTPSYGLFGSEEADNSKESVYLESQSDHASSSIDLKITHQNATNLSNKPMNYYDSSYQNIQNLHKFKEFDAKTCDLYQVDDSDKCILNLDKQNTNSNYNYDANGIYFHKQNGDYNGTTLDYTHQSSNDKNKDYVIINSNNDTTINNHTHSMNQGALKNKIIKNTRNADHNVNACVDGKAEYLLDEYLPSIDSLAKYNQISLEDVIEKRTSMKECTILDKALANIRANKPKNFIKDSSQLSKLMSISRKAQHFLHKLNSSDQSLTNASLAWKHNKGIGHPGDVSVSCVYDAPPANHIKTYATSGDNNETLLNLSLTQNNCFHADSTLNAVPLKEVNKMTDTFLMNKQSNNFKTNESYFPKNISGSNIIPIIQQDTNSLNPYQSHASFNRDILTDPTMTTSSSGCFTNQVYSTADSKGVSLNRDSFNKLQNLSGFNHEKYTEETSSTLSGNDAVDASSASRQFFSDPNQVVSGLPFSVPPVPLGYRLVITHLPINNDQQPDFKNITQLIIDNPTKQSTVIPHTSVDIDHSQPLSYANNQLENPVQNLVVRQKSNLLTSSSPLMDTSSSDPIPSNIENFNFTKNKMEEDTSVQSSQNQQEVLRQLTRKFRPLSKNRATYSKWNLSSFIKKIDPDTSGFMFYLDVATSISTRPDEDRVTYLNKGQPYPLILSHQNPEDTSLTNFKSIIVLVFRDSVSAEATENPSQNNNLTSWNCWYHRQHTYRQRAIEIEVVRASTKDEYNDISTQEISHNAVIVSWRSSSVFKLSLAVNCLSTDFCQQKGVTGSPLHVQVDTYRGEVAGGKMVHRAYCQVKVFSDKGADRKSREEEKKRTREDESWERSMFYRMQDLNTPPFLFTPHQDVFPSSLQTPTTSVSSLSLSSSSSSSVSSSISSSSSSSSLSTLKSLHSSIPTTIKRQGEFCTDTKNSKNRKLSVDGAYSSLSESLFGRMYMKGEENVTTALEVTPLNCNPLSNTLFSGMDVAQGQQTYPQAPHRQSFL